MGAILAIDQGTSGTKSIVVGQDDSILSLVEKPIRPRYLPNGGVEQDPAELLNSVLSTAHEAVSQAGVELEAVTLTNQGETVLSWDQHSGEPLTDLIVWQDSRAQGICDELAQCAGMIAQRTGLVLDPYFTAPKMTWLRRNLTTEGVVTTSDVWLLHQLTGEFVTDAATASRSLLKSQNSTHWDLELLGIFGLDNEPQPRIAANDEVVGHTSLFGAPVPVAGAVVDQQGALLAQSCLQPGDAKCTFGTGAFLLVNSGTTPSAASSALSESTAWIVDNQQWYCFDGQVYTAASAIRWLEQLGMILSPAQMDAIAVEDTAGIMFIPALAGLAAPWWASEAKAAFTGMTLATGKAELVSAVLQGIAANVAVLAGLVTAGAGTPIQSLRVDGGLTRSRFLMQAVADLLQVEVETYASPHATPLGAVALARKALDKGRTLQDCVPKWSPGARYTPKWGASRAAEFINNWRNQVDKVVA